MSSEVSESNQNDDRDEIFITDQKMASIMDELINDDMMVRHATVREEVKDEVTNEVFRPNTELQVIVQNITKAIVH